ncbi:uncharacterized protein [Spinacia oleracea]|uniref:DUF4283 domain-containing protein n=1 Tax=Spinacia oleracea TaxID=3562 RepID=A0A9R0K3N3_SPIOL|nr:uncharacterized protein LOC110796521 [Spinacia oleracea]
MGDEIISQYSKLRLEEEEGDVDLGDVVSDDPQDNLDLLLIGRMMTDRPYNVEAFKRTMKKVWAPVHNLVIRVLGPNLYAFQFFHWKDKEKVLQGRPWCFENTLILMKEIEGDEQPKQVVLTHSPFWVRIKKLPFNCRSNAHVKTLVAGMGELIEIEEDILGLDRYRRVKLLLDVTKPLLRVKRFKDRRGREIEAEFVYERLPFFLLCLWYNGTC